MNSSLTGNIDHFNNANVGPVSGWCHPIYVGCIVDVSEMRIVSIKTKWITNCPCQCLENGAIVTTVLWTHTIITNISRGHWLSHPTAGSTLTLNRCESPKSSIFIFPYTWAWNPARI